ncbi:hypothetical protein ATX71_09050 [Oenococcus oeni]|uniref:Uncharacterized protein n=2 Tax=Oenococcus oeni TaxID=1247 RepID=Q04CZ1_OENOB|nr:hypothetical protein OEOE_1849 [Oenococcus oeni PSU-1]AWW98802.1 hypothetical protein C5H79_04465 [Oenococcus oeni]EFD87559.1 hypothetical protein AWRIB429_1901 [Oenococcus oeni AWRIB429]EJN91521.1 hypothetical protein AWRIB304_1711 [Oenococcus oeni AWRIB304]EJN99662.1 hypothetical protein AWRIB419_1397 [Oenococcus oeni AWRIB419]EJO03037.1 hypothetical protein AWRIB318_222 [Oenococcus oeni AWRIB318]EJO06595.1 hypothetical protein AWRIB548_622 [Oenococcus oeni AWRIB548]EJO07542.1 hypotheti
MTNVIAIARQISIQAIRVFFNVCSIIHPFATKALFLFIPLRQGIVNVIKTIIFILKKIKFKIDDFIYF